MNPLLHAVIGRILRRRTCPACQREQVVQAGERLETVPCKFCGADIPPRKD